MIRRDVLLPDGRPGWALISQVEHARIAAEVCRAWNVEAYPLAVPHEELLAAVVHHDDGWLAWEIRPTVLDGKPRDFMEMPLDESLAIWRRSIAVAQTLGPLAAYAVGSHFAALCRWSHEKTGHTDEWRHLAEEFIEEQDELAGERLAELITRAERLRDGDSRAVAAGTGAVLQAEVKKNADRAWHALQFFDRVSLWLCCAAPTKTETIDVPESLGAGLGAFQFKPYTTDGLLADITCEPWPLSGDRLEIATVADAVPQADYDTPDALARAERTPLPLRWVLVRQ